MVWTDPSSPPVTTTLELKPMLRALILFLWFLMMRQQFFVLKSHSLPLVSAEPLTIKWSYFLSANKELTSTVCPLRQKLTVSLDWYFFASWCPRHWWSLDCFLRWLTSRWWWRWERWVLRGYYWFACLVLLRVLSYQCCRGWDCSISLQLQRNDCFLMQTFHIIFFCP